METTVNYARVGAFVIILFILMMVGVIGLSKGFSSGQYTTYQVFMRESISGLSVDAPIEFNGVPIGRVQAIEIDQKDPQVVILLLDVRRLTPITQGTRAMLNTKGLTGIAYLALIDKGTDVRPLIALPGESFPVIKTAPSLLMRFDSTFTEISRSLADVSIAMKLLLDTDNLQSIKHILYNTNIATKNISDITRSVKLNPSILIRGQAPLPLGPGESR